MEKRDGPPSGKSVSRLRISSCGSQFLVPCCWSRRKSRLPCGMDPQKRELFRILGATPLQTLLRLKIPSGLPVILAGLRVAVVLALVGAVVAEFIAGRAGLGAMIIASQGMMDSPQMFALLVVITAIGMAFYQAILIIERWALRRHQKGSDQ